MYKCFQATKFAHKESGEAYIKGPKQCTRLQQQWRWHAKASLATRHPYLFGKAAWKLFTLGRRGWRDVARPTTKFPYKEERCGWGRSERERFVNLASPHRKSFKNFCYPCKADRNPAVLYKFAAKGRKHMYAHSEQQFSENARRIANSLLLREWEKHTTLKFRFFGIFL